MAERARSRPTTRRSVIGGIKFALEAGQLKLLPAVRTLRDYGQIRYENKRAERIILRVKRASTFSTDTKNGTRFMRPLHFKQLSKKKKAFVDASLKRRSMRNGIRDATPPSRPAHVLTTLKSTPSSCVTCIANGRSNTVAIRRPGLTSSSALGELRPWQFAA